MDHVRVRIQVPAGRQLQFFDSEGNPLQAPGALQLTREIELPDLEPIKFETTAQIVANRVGVTGALLGIAIGAAVLLGRPRD